jgi:hypothetical protein
MRQTYSRQHYTDRQIVDELTYTSYATQRDNSPEVIPERWGKIYGVEPAQLMEERYQAEQEEKYGSCKMCGERHAYEDMSNRTCSECREPDLADYRYEQRIDRELMASSR